MWRLSDALAALLRWAGGGQPLAGEQADELTRLRAAGERLARELAATERELAATRREAAENAARLRPFADSSIIGVIVGDFGGALTEANDAFLWMVGHGRDDLDAGRLSWVELTAPEHRDLDRRMLGRLQRRGVHAPFEKEYVRKDGTRIPVLVISMALLDEAADRWIGFVLPLIERRSSQEALRASEAQLAGVIASVMDPIITVDEVGHIVVFNPAAERLLGSRAGDVLGQSIERFIPERFRRAHAEHIGFFGATDAGRPMAGTSGTLVWRRADGEEFSLEVAISPAEAGGQRLHTIILRDITDRARAEEERRQLLAHAQAARAEAEAANRAKDEFLATLSHELRTPLSAMLTWTGLLRMGKLDAPTRARAVDALDRNAHVLTQLIGDLLDVSRIITGKLRLEVETLELPPIVAAALEAVRPAAQAKGVEVSCVLHPGLATVSGDAARLQQVVWNLLANAIKFTSRGGQVAVTLDTVGSWMRLRVTDTGRGIDPELLPYIFERFRQADSTTTRTHGGLGLGLAIVRHLVELHGGVVDAESDGEGRGARFTVRLPVAAVHATGAAAEPTAAAPSADDHLGPRRLDGVRVLVVDDHADARDSITATLEQWGARVLTAGSAAEAVAALPRFRPDVLLSDIGMPEEDGYAFIRAVRRRPREAGGRVPAAALTAYARAEDRARALQAGYQVHVAKPIDPVELVDVVAHLAGRSGGPAAAGRAQPHAKR